MLAAQSPRTLRDGLVVPVPEYEPRTVEWVFRRTTQPELGRIYADGSEDSPHRYASDDRDPRSPLCIWHPEDPPELRWVPRDGLLPLIEMTRIHLFKEAYWREKADWPGDEAPHGGGGGKPC